MTKRMREGPNHSDDPRREAGDYMHDNVGVPSEFDRRITRHGSDLVRVANGQPPRHSLESKIPFLSDEAIRIADLIGNSELGEPKVKSMLSGYIDKALKNNQITSGESVGLLHYLSNAEVGDDEAQASDHLQRQMNDY